jgi:Uma2 family endonuclease
MAEAARREDWPGTVAEFEDWHARRPERWEFIDGQPRLMAPASMVHAIIENNVGFAIRQALDGSACTALVDGPQIPTDEISAIPDVVVTCIPARPVDPIIAEPVIIVEVMSPSSEPDDAGRKWFSYRKIPSLRHYLVVSPGRARRAGVQSCGRPLARALRQACSSRPARRSASTWM